MPDFRNIAKEYIKNGYSVIPVNKTKNPTIKWTKYQTSFMSNEEIEKHFKNCWGLGFITGTLSSTVAIDWDTKYFLDSNLYNDIKEAIPDSILKKMYVNSTMSGGWHWIFKVDKSAIKGNQKLAMRYTTPYERDISYRKAYKNPRTRDKALEIGLADACRVLVETREHGGFVVHPPSSGYKAVYGKIEEISLEEYDILITTIRSFNEFNLNETKHKIHDNNKWSITPFDDYNENSDVLNLLLEHGWEELDSRNNSVRLKRPGSPLSASSGLLDLNTNILNVFSTSTVFENGRGYNPVSIYNILESNNDWGKTLKDLIELDYGEKNKDD